LRNWFESAGLKEAKSGQQAWPSDAAMRFQAGAKFDHALVSMTVPTVPEVAFGAAAAGALAAAATLLLSLSPLLSFAALALAGEAALGAGGV
jgi:hypothetical protein